MNPVFIGFVAAFIASLITAYSMGWQVGHDIHHDDDTNKHSRGGGLKPPSRPNLYI